jgi:hypothetical protein
MECECVITIDFPGPAEEHYQSLKKYVQQYNEMIEGDSGSGFFSVPLPVLGTITGVYIVSGQTLMIYIIKKSMLLSCHTIENFLREAISANLSRVREAGTGEEELEDIRALQNL